MKFQTVIKYLTGHTTYKEPGWSSSIYYYGLGQAGMSAYFSKDKVRKLTVTIIININSFLS